MDNPQLRQAKIVVLRLLSASPKSRAEIEKKLEDKGFEAGVIKLCLDEFENQKIVNDKRFAEDIISKFQFGKVSGKRRIAFELKRHKIKTDDVDALLQDIPDEEEYPRALEIGQAKWDSSAKLEIDKRKKRVYSFLIRRGFDFSIAKEVVDTLNSSNPK